MKNLMYFLLIVLSISCKNENAENQKDLLAENVQEDYQSFGEKIDAENSLNALEMLEKFKDLKPGDTISEKFTTQVLSVCKMKGCWMTLDLPETDEDPMVKFKDYGFFMPKDIEGKTVIVQGKAFIDEVSVEDQKHFAEDGGKSQEEIAAINAPKKSYGFVAEGVLLK